MGHLNILFLLMAFLYSSSAENNLDILKNLYGEGYGTEWIYMPDSDGKLHYVDLTLSADDLYLASFFTEEVVQFKLYNKNIPLYILLDSQGQAKNDTEQEIVTEILKSNLNLKLITHGWRSSADIKTILDIKDAYLQAQNVNVITVDWSDTADSIYFWSVHQTRYVEKQIARLLDGLNATYNVTGDQLHLIGHSLGAHVMGNAASKTNLRVYRVTGLDPARPLYEFPFQVSPSERLDPSDAEIVDVIHTCAGLLGFNDNLGTVDFYPNQGSAPQPGCESITKWLGACSHSIGFSYFMESIKKPKMYPAFKCASWEDFLDHRCNQNGYMGDSVSGNMTGTHYLTTAPPEKFNYITYLNVLPDNKKSPTFLSLE